jgi:hypothetical protein
MSFPCCPTESPCPDHQVSPSSPDAADQPVPYTLTARAEAVLASWDRDRQLPPELEAEAEQ